MSIQHHHFPNLPSTQSFLKEKWGTLRPRGENILISTDQQTMGAGRQGAPWKHLTGSLAISFVISGHQPFLGLTSLEMGCLITKFFKDSPLQLKWPNDLFIHNQKCGGLILQNLSGPLFACGLGLNINQTPGALKGLDHDRKAGALRLQDETLLKNLAYELYSFILNNRMSSKEIRKNFLDLCPHLDKACEIKQGDEVQGQGIFVGIGEQGEALLKDKAGPVRPHFSGSLYWDRD